ncbi:MAG: glycosyltransferase [Bacteroidetes bacterium]|nr:MAG: glycosyltransferase [Bacteroidota bacterium]
MRVAYITSTDPTNKAAWSGTHYYMLQALQRHVGEVNALGPFHAGNVLEISGKVLDRLCRLQGRHYDRDHSLLRSRACAKFFGEKLHQGRYDVIVAPAASTEVAFLNVKDKPLIYLSDATFHLLSGYYPNFQRFGRLSRWEGNQIERRAIEKSTLTIMSSEWAAESAIRDYGADSAKVRVIPFGANIDTPPTREQALQRLTTRDPVCRLLFLARDWHRKGGDIVLESFSALRAQNIPVNLVICGCEPPDRVFDQGIEVIPYLDKNRPEGYARFLDLLLNSHFMLLPTRADCTPIVLAEAAAYGMPVITTDTGGIRSMVEHGKTGYVLPITARGSEYASLIREAFTSPMVYERLVVGARDRFEQQLNWDAWGQRFKRCLAEVNVNIN